MGAHAIIALQGSIVLSRDNANSARRSVHVGGRTQRQLFEQQKKQKETGLDEKKTKNNIRRLLFIARMYLNIPTRLIRGAFQDKSTNANTLIFQKKI